MIGSLYTQDQYQEFTLPYDKGKIMQLEKLTDQILQGYLINRDEALKLVEYPLEQLRISAKKITGHFFKEKIELCCISNGKCGNCTENCKLPQNLCHDRPAERNRHGNCRLKGEEAVI